ncbi:MAG: M20 family metallopeptidase [Proteobacteria bacterium]|nr:M20 family metallopeptidase [Pseudomonadota bacterium]
MNVDERAGLKSGFLCAIDSLKEKVTALSAFIFDNPEPAFKEFKTSGAMQDFLREHGFQVETAIAGMETAFRATLGSGAPVIALLAEMDSLPELGHACGHNIVGAASVGAASALSQVLDAEFKRGGHGTLMVLGTPAEEEGHGKTEMVAAGVFGSIDAAMMVHGSSRRMVSKHFLGLSVLHFTFSGRAAHASAYPEEGINALNAVIQTFNAINALRQHVPSDVRIHGIVTDGGKAANIVPETASAEFFVRAFAMDEVESLKERVIKCARGAAEATGCTLEVTEVGEPNAPMKINRAFAAAYKDSLRQLGLKEDEYKPDKNLGSSDIGNVSQVVPSIHPNVPLRKGIAVHTRDFAVAAGGPDGHRATIEGASALGLTAIELLFNTELLESVKKDFASS